MSLCLPNIQLRPVRCPGVDLGLVHHECEEHEEVLSRSSLDCLHLTVTSTLVVFLKALMKQSMTKPSILGIKSSVGLETLM